MKNVHININAVFKERSHIMAMQSDHYQHSIHVIKILRYLYIPSMSQFDHSKQIINIFLNM